MGLVRFDRAVRCRDLPSNEVVTSDDLTSPFGLLVIRRFGHLWRVHAGARETLKVVLAHSAAFQLAWIECNWNPEPMPKQVEAWQKSELTDLLLRNSETDPISFRKVRLSSRCQLSVIWPRSSMRRMSVATKPGTCILIRLLVSIRQHYGLRCSAVRTLGARLARRFQVGN
jgi:hypothetical protein